MDGRLVAIAGVLCLALLGVGKFLHADDFSVLVWGDRDLWRGLEFFISPDARGPESNTGFRPPGGFFYMFLNAIFRLSLEVKAANIALGLMLVTGAAAMALTMWRLQSPRAGAFAGLAFFGNGITLHTYGVWNPGFVLFFTAIATCALLCAVATRRAAFFGLATFAIGLGMQIHMQIAVLLLAIPFVMIAARILPRAAIVAAAVLGLFLAYLPSLIIDSSAFSDFFFHDRNRSGLDEYVRSANTALAGFAETLRQFFFAAGGSSDALGTALRPRFAAIDAFLWVADIAAFALALFAIAGVARPRWFPTSGDSRPFVAATVIVIVYLAAFAFASVGFRHFVAIVPAVSILVAVGAETAVRRLSTPPPTPVRVLAALAIIGLIVGRSAVVAAIANTDTSLSPHSYKAQREIADHVKAKYYPDNETFEARTSYVIPNGAKWYMAAPDIGNRMATVFRLSRATPTTTSDPRCLAVVARWLAENARPEEIVQKMLALPPFANLRPVFDKPTASPNHLYFPFRTADGNCLKSFPNPYIPTAYEHRYLPIQRTPVDRPSVLAAAGAPREGIFVIAFPSSPFPWAIDIAAEGAGHVATIHGRILRGHTGLHVATLEDTRVHFTDGGIETSVNFGSASIGDIAATTLVPWRSAPFVLKPGRYNARLTTIIRPNVSVDIPLGTLTVGADGSLIARIAEP